MVISVPQCAHTRTCTHAHFYTAKTHLCPCITFTEFPETSQTLLVLGGKHGGAGLYHTIALRGSGSGVICKKQCLLQHGKPDGWSQQNQDSRG